jgi:hypothetical protein
MQTHCPEVDIEICLLQCKVLLYIVVQLLGLWRSQIL